jgi:hypothetical protein
MLKSLRPEKKGTIMLMLTSGQQIFIALPFSFIRLQSSICIFPSKDLIKIICHDSRAPQAVLLECLELVLRLCL